MTPLQDQTPAGIGPPGAAASAAGRGLDEDVPCSACGYNLRGLSSGGTCPECGGEINRSIHQWSQFGRLLKGDPRWVRKLGRAMDLALLSVASAIAVPPLWLIGVLTLGRTSPRVPGTSVPVLSLLWVVAVGLAPPTLGLTASWWFSAAPAAKGPPLRRWPRLLARAAAIAFVVAIGTLLALGLADSKTNLPNDFYAWGMLAIVLIAILGVFAAGTYAAELAEYLEDSTLSLNTVVMTWIDGILGVVALAVGTMALVGQSVAPNQTDLEAFFPPVGCALACGLPLAGVLTLVLMIWFRVRLARIIRRGFWGPWRGEETDY